MRKKITLDSFVINIQDFLNIFRTFWELIIERKKNLMLTACNGCEP